MRTLFRFSLALSLFLLPLSAHGASHTLRVADIVYSVHNSAYAAYNTVLPLLMRTHLFAPDDPADVKIENTVRFINFHSNPDTFASYYHYSDPHVRSEYTGQKQTWQLMSLLFKTGNLMCSDQAACAKTILEQDFPRARVRDAVHHTVIEIMVGGRWVPLDPYTDMRIRNHEGRLASVKDILAYRNGQTDRLRLDSPPSRHALRYFELWNPDEYTPVRHPFDAPIVVDTISYTDFLGVPIKTFLQFLKARGDDIEDHFVLEYMIYLRNVFALALRNSPTPRKLAARIQDYFLDRIREQGDPKIFDGLYFARQYQLMERHEKALSLFATLPPTKRNAYFTALSHYRLGDKAAFNASAQRLENNIWYRYQFWRLTGRFLKPGDAKRFAGFMNKLYAYDAAPMLAMQH